MRDESLKTALNYGKFKGPVKILLFDADYLVVRDARDGAAQLGIEVVPLQTKAKGRAEGSFVSVLLKTLLTHRPDFVLTINHLGFDEGGVLAQLLARYAIPTASWFVDHPLPILGGAPKNATDHTVVFCFERTALAWLADQGYADPVHLPTGTNRRIFDPRLIDRSLAAQLTLPLTFAGNSWWTKARLEPLPKVQQLAARFVDQVKLDRTVVANGFAQILAEFPVRSPNARLRYAMAQVALAEASMQTRRRFVTALKESGVCVFGDPHWQRLVPGVELRPFVDYEVGLPALFHFSGVNANVTAEQMPTAVNQRVWDVPAAGGFLLTDAQQDALECFEENEEIAVYRSIEEATSKAAYYTARPEVRRKMVERAMARVEQCHTVAHRIQRLVDEMRRRFA